MSLPSLPPHCFTQPGMEVNESIVLLAGQAEIETCPPRVSLTSPAVDSSIRPSVPAGQTPQCCCAEGKTSFYTLKPLDTLQLLTLYPPTTHPITHLPVLHPLTTTANTNSVIRPPSSSRLPGSLLRDADYWQATGTSDCSKEHFWFRWNQG